MTDSERPLAERMTAPRRVRPGFERDASGPDAARVSHAAAAPDGFRPHAGAARSHGDSDWDEEDFDAPVDWKGRPARRASGVVGSALAALLGVGVLAGLIWVAYSLGIREGVRSAPPRLSASADPFKHRPEDRGGERPPNQDITTAYGRAQGEAPPTPERVRPPEDEAGGDEEVAQIAPAGDDAAAGGAFSADAATEAYRPLAVPGARGDVPALNSGDAGPANAEAANAGSTNVEAANAGPATAESANAAEAANAGAADRTDTGSTRRDDDASALANARPGARPETAATAPSDAADAGAAGWSAEVATADAAGAPPRAPARLGAVQPIPATTPPPQAPAPATRASTPATGASTDAAAPPAESDAAAAAAEDLAAEDTAAEGLAAGDPATQAAPPASSTGAAGAADGEPPVIEGPIAPGSYVQLAAFRNATGALAAWRRLRDRAPTLLGGREVVVQAGEIRGRGQFYRVKVGPYAQRGEATKLCADLKAAGVDCLVLNQ